MDDEEKFAGSQRAVEQLWNSIKPETKTKYYNNTIRMNKTQMERNHWNTSRIEIMKIHSDYKHPSKLAEDDINGFIENLKLNVDVFNQEISLEEQYIESLEKKEKRVNFVFYSWSAMRSLMLSYESPTDNAYKLTFFTAFSRVLVSYTMRVLNFTGNPGSLHYFLNEKNVIFSILTSYRDFLDGLVMKIENKTKMEQLAVEGFYDEMKKALYRIGVTQEDQTTFNSKARKLFNLSKQVVGKKRDRTEEVRVLGSEKPIAIPYSQVLELARYFWTGIIDGRSLDDFIFGGIEISTDDQCANALCLLELCSGSRSQGVTANNRIQKYSNILEKDKKIMKAKKYTDNERLEVPNEVFDVYSESLGNIIMVDNLSKEKSDLKGAMSTFVRLEGAFPNLQDAETRKKVEALKDDQRQKIVIKPILYDYFDPKYILPENVDKTKIKYGSTLYEGEGKYDDEGDRTMSFNFQTYIFLQLLCECRRYMYYDFRDNICVRHMEIDTAGPNTMDLFYVSSKDECKTQRALFGRIEDMKEKMRHLISEKVLQKQFGKRSPDIIKIFSYGKKTHQLRKIYVAVAYMFYTDMSMKEISFAKYVLGHETLSTSLSYLNVRIIKTVDESDLCEWLFKETLLQKSRVNFMVDILQNRVLDATVLDDRVQLMDESGELVWFSKFKRSKRHLDPDDQEESRKKRIIEAIDILESKNVKPTTFSIRSLGVQVSKNEIDDAKKSDYVPSPEF